MKLAFVPTISISLLLLAIAAMHQAPALSKGLWVAGTVLHAGLTLYVMSSWIRHDKFEITHLNPAWFIPVVGNILVPIAGVTARQSRRSRGSSSGSGCSSGRC